MNSTIVLDRLVAARNEGGSAHAVTQAQAMVREHFPNRIFDVENTVNAVFNAVDRFNRPAAETAINEALAMLNRPEPVAETTVAGTAVAEPNADHEARLAALEALARNNGYGHMLPVAGASHEQRLVALERVARTAGLR